MIFDPERPGSLRATARQLQRLAMFLRERTSNDLWRVLRALGDKLAMPASTLGMLAGDAMGVLNQTLLSLAAFRGLARENMTRAHGWRFLDMGQRIERSIYLCAFLDHALGSPDAGNPSVLEAVLEVADSTITYRGRYNLLPNIAAVYDLALLDDTNPRSLLFQFNQLVKHFDRLPGERESALPSPGQRVLLECLTGPAPAGPARFGPAEGPLATERRGPGDPTDPPADCRRLSDAIAAAISPIPPSPAREGAPTFDMTCDVVHRTLYQYSGACDRFAARGLSGAAGAARPASWRDFSLRSTPRPRCARCAPITSATGFAFSASRKSTPGLEIVAQSRVTIAAVTPPVLGLSPEWEKVAALFRRSGAGGGAGLMNFVFDSPLLRASPALAAYARPSFVPGTPLLSARWI